MFAALPFPPDPREVEVAPQSRLPSKLCPKLSCRHHPLQARVKGRSGIVTGLSFYPHAYFNFLVLRHCLASRATSHQGRPFSYLPHTKAYS